MPDEAALQRIFLAGYGEFAQLQRQPGIAPDAVAQGVERSLYVAVAEQEASGKGPAVSRDRGFGESLHRPVRHRVRGIMNSFGLSQVQQAALSTVAPGIAEALIATAIGLFAAIPAVMAYNRFAARGQTLVGRYYAFGNELQRACISACTPLHPTSPQPPEEDAFMLVKPQHKHGPKAEMNVVPYIDVMLVLLVIFMVTAPMLVQGVKIEAAQVAAEALPVENERQILTLSVKADGGFYWNGQRAGHRQPDRQRRRPCRAAGQGRRDHRRARRHRVYVRADEAADYGRVVAGIAELQRGGVVNTGLITEAPAAAEQER